jgi:hypothetical protein
LTATWLVIATALSAFSFTVVAGASTFGRPDYDRAVKDLTNDLSGGRQDVDDRRVDDVGRLVGRLLTSSDGRLCVVSPSALTRISARYDVGRLSISLRGSSLDIVSVKNASEGDLRALLGPGGVSCTLVHVSRAFYLPFDANLS